MPETTLHPGGGRAAIVLSGGSSRRMGRPKTAELVGGRTLLARVTDALPGVRSVAVIGSDASGARFDVLAREEPNGSGPVAAVAAGLPLVSGDPVFVLAGDLPFLTATALDELTAALIAAGSDVALALDDRGRDQYLLSVWRAAALARHLAAVGDVRGASVRKLYDGADVTRVALAGDPPPWWDCDTPDSLARARAVLPG